MKIKYNKRHPTSPSFKGMTLELGGNEGFYGKDLKVCAVKFGVDGDEFANSIGVLRYRKKKPLRLYLKVIGFVDDLVPTGSRNWGKRI